MQLIASGPAALLGSTDYQAWLYGLEAKDGSISRLEVRLLGTANASDSTTLPDEVAEAKQTKGRSVIERILPWQSLPSRIEIGSEWIALFYGNGHCSRIGKRLPEGIEALIERQRLRISRTQGVEDIYEHTNGHWNLKSFQNGSLRRDEPCMLSDVIGKVSAEQAQLARDIDPEGTARLSP